MNFQLAGRNALVCGASQGIGLAAAKALATLGASVTMVSRSQEKLRAGAAELPRIEGQIHAWIASDLSGADAAMRLAADLNLGARPMHILVNNTGGPPGGPVLEAAPAEFLTAFSSQVLVSHALVQAVVPGMKAAEYGRIINVISTSVKAPIPNLGVSNTIRAAVASWAKTLAGELGAFGITVNNVLPGYTRTDRLRSLLASRAAKSGQSEEHAAQELIGGIPARRFGEPDEIGAAIAFLASPAAGYINGINLPVDGGRLPTL